MLYSIENDQIVEFNQHQVEYLYSRYVPDNSLIVPDGKTIQGSSIPDYIKSVIFDDAQNSVDVEAHAKEIHLDIPHYFVSGSYNYHQDPPNDPRILYFPFWAVWSSQQNPKFSSTAKIHQFSCLNGRLRPHRNLLYLELSKRHWFTDMIFTFGNQDHRDDTLSNWQLTPEENTAFWHLPLRVTWIDTDATVGIDVGTDHPAFHEAYINIVTETNFDISKQMLSEKSFKPIITGQLFVLLASPGAVRFLRAIGIDTFDDVVDHSYDSIIDNRERFNAALAEIDRLAAIDFAPIYNQIKPRLEKNSLYLSSQEFRDQFPLRFD